jgi:hypothetical protein
LAGKDSDLDFSLIQPASVNRRVVDREAVPDFAANLLAEKVGKGLAAMDVEIVDD